MTNSNEEDLKSFIKSDIINKTKKVRGNHPPIAENIDNIQYSLSVKSIYDLNVNLKNFFLIILKNYSKKPRFRNFLVISFANNSSDLLVQLAREIVLKHDLKLIQYSIYPKTLRIQLLCMVEIQTINNYIPSIKVLQSVRKEFRRKLVRLKDLTR